METKESKSIEKRFVSYKEGAEMYSLGLNTFQKIAKEANACYKLGKRVIVSCEMIEKYIEQFRV